LVAATSLLAARAKEDAGAMHLWRSLEQARQTADAATTVAEGFFDSAYASRHESPALPPEGLRHAIDIALRMTGAEQARKAVEYQPDEPSFPLRNLSGIDFLLMMVPALAATLARAAPDTTVGIRTEQVPRLDGVIKGAGQHGFLWLNRRHALSSHRGLAIVILASAAPFTGPEVEAWLRGQHAPLASIPARGLVLGIQKCHGLLGAAVAPRASHFGLTLVLPT
jgi:hypothetical protein